jgi:hypothetical protein
MGSSSGQDNKQWISHHRSGYACLGGRNYKTDTLKLFVMKGRPPGHNSTFLNFNNDRQTEKQQTENCCK